MENISQIYEKLLDISSLSIDSVEIGEKAIIMECHTKATHAPCQVCGSTTEKIHQYHSHKLRDLNLCGREVFLHLRVKQYVCDDCGRYFTETLNFADLGKSYTHRQAKFIFEMSRQQSYSAVAALVNMHAKTVERIVLWYSERLVLANLPARYRQVRRLGIDELSNRKGKKDFICVLTNLDTGEHLDLLPDRKKETLMAHFQSLGKEFCAQITDVSCDMWEPYIQVAQACFPQANIVCDRFHVTKLLNDCLDQFRKQLRRADPKNEAYMKLKWILYKQYHTLNDEQIDCLQKAFDVQPELKECYFLRESFHHIMDNSPSIEKAMDAIEKWVRGIQDAKIQVFDPFLKTLERRKEYILSYVKDYLSNAVTEGLNNLIRQIKRASWGMPNFEHLRLRVLAFSL